MLNNLFNAILNIFSSAEQEFSTVPFDGIPWSFQRPNEKVVAVGDLHGDLEALTEILHRAELLSPEGAWIGGPSHLVLLGDLIGGHGDSVLLLQFLMRIEREAEKAGGRLHALLGNHDVLPIQGNFNKFTRKEKKMFKKHIGAIGKTGHRVEQVFLGNSEIAKWLRGRNTILKIGDQLFVHAGIDDWLLSAEVGRINSTIRAWISYWQGVGAKPPKVTRWTVGKPVMKRGSRFEIGPLWQRSFKAGLKKQNEAPTLTLVSKILESLGVKQVIVGHSPVYGERVLFEHPRYGSRVVMLDTKISDPKRGQLCALEIQPQGLREIYVEERILKSSVRDREAEKFEERTLGVYAILKKFWERFF